MYLSFLHPNFKTLTVFHTLYGKMLREDLKSCALCHVVLEKDTKINMALIIR